MPSTVHDNTSAQRYEMHVAGKTAFISYRRTGGSVILLHAEVPQELSGRGLGTALVEATLEHARSRGEKIVPRCPFIASYIKRHPHFQDLVVGDDHLG